MSTSPPDASSAATPKKPSVLGCVAFYGCILAFVLFGCNYAFSSFMERGRQAGGSPAVALVDTGDRVRLRSQGAQGVIVAVSQQALDDAGAAAAANDRTDQNQLLIDGQVWLLPVGTVGTVLDTSLTAVELEFEDGSRGWIGREAVTEQ